MASTDPVRGIYSWLDDFLREQWETYKPPSRDRFRASEAGKCGRGIWYRLSGFRPDKPRSAFVELITKDGDLLHDCVRYWLRKTGAELFDLDFKDDGVIEETNRRCVPITHNGEEFKIAFRSDGGVVIDGERHVLEIKTIDGFSYKWMEDAFLRGGWKRLLRYMKLKGKDDEDGKRNRGDKYAKFFAQSTVSGLLSQPPLLKAYIIVKNRSLGQTGFGQSNEGMSFDLTQEAFDKILNSFAYVNKHVREVTVPMQEFTMDSQDCKFCDYRERCWEKEKANG